MKELKLTVKINKPLNEVFNFTLNPNNTPLWIDSVEKEETSEWPVRVGTTYRNHGEDKVWNVYTLTKLEEGKSFVLTKKDNNYHVQYTFREVDKNGTEFEYYEWVDQGELGDPFTQDILEKLKNVLESE